MLLHQGGSGRGYVFRLIVFRSVTLPSVAMAATVPTFPFLDI